MSTAADYLNEETLSDGSKVTIRAMRADDEDRLIKAFLNLEPHTVRMRFFCFKNDLSENDLKWLETMDYVSDVGLVATLPSGGDEVIIGEGRYVARGQTAEIAFTVEEDWQGRGIAGRLLRHLARIARNHGVVQFEADVLRENAPMLAVFRRSGFPMTTRDGGEEIRVTLLLSAESLPRQRNPDAMATVR
ncbi:MAG TPA: GNAT family N-acetyltransferase [Burkholderiaceae bacterium]|nr:GNAT family N-acetyltransferase [Burkholderiaceae bacterium]